MPSRTMPGASLIRSPRAPRGPFDGDDRDDKRMASQPAAAAASTFRLSGGGCDGFSVLRISLKSKFSRVGLSRARSVACGDARPSGRRRGRSEAIAQDAAALGAPDRDVPGDLEDARAGGAQAAGEL